MLNGAIQTPVSSAARETDRANANPSFRDPWRSCFWRWSQVKPGAQKLMRQAVASASTDIIIATLLEDRHAVGGSHGQANMVLMRS